VKQRQRSYTSDDYLKYIKGILRLSCKMLFAL
jgi:hypothetical protein